MKKILKTCICGECFLTRRQKKNEQRYCSLECWQNSSEKKSLGHRQRYATLDKCKEGSKSYRKMYGQYEHRVVAASILGRPLRRDEFVHHENGNRRDNRPENLMIVTPQQHYQIHRQDREQGYREWLAAKHFAASPTALHDNVISIAA